MKSGIINAVFARRLGWTEVEVIKEGKPAVVIGHPPNNKSTMSVPRFTESKTLMATVINDLTMKEQMKFSEEMVKIQMRDSTPHQQAEAVMRTISTWMDGK